MAARRLGVDPAELARRNLVREDEFPYRVASGIVWTAPAFGETLDSALQPQSATTRCREEQAKARIRRPPLRHRHRHLTPS